MALVLVATLSDSDQTCDTHCEPIVHQGNCVGGSVVIRQWEGDDQMRVGARFCTSFLLVSAINVLLRWNSYLLYI
jgi:hypothetical protein